MRIGILTHTPRLNYGGIIQAYALQKVLNDMGHQVFVFDKPYYRKLPSYKKPFVYAKRIFVRLLFNKKEIIFKEKIFNKDYPIIAKELQSFINKNINRTIINNLSQLNASDFDLIIVGSDQIWRPDYFKTMWSRDVSDAFLRFAEKWNVKRISYAASFGVDFWMFSEKETEKCKKYAQLFDGISVREKSGVELCRKYLSVKSTHVLDPTMLLDKNDYIEIIHQKNGTKDFSGNLLVYLLDNSLDKEEFVTNYALKHSLTPFFINTKDNQYKVPIETWLNSFVNAKFVITDSFHACVFSIIFNKPFVILKNKERGNERIASLIADFHIKYEERDNILFPFLDYDQINLILKRKREESILYLKQFLY